MATQAAASARPPDKVVHKWKVFKAVCVARPRLGVSERALAVLNALISFYPDTTLTGEDDLIVFPSNELLCLRTHGMPASTLRRQLAALVDAGLIVRRDSPNGKRYARKGRAGEIKLAFGFDLAPLVVRADAHSLVDTSTFPFVVAAFTTLFRSCPCTPPLVVNAVSRTPRGTFTSKSILARCPCQFQFQ